MLKSFDEMTPDQQLAYRMGYEAARSELRVAGRDDLLIRREDIDYESAAKAVSKALRYEYPQLNFPPGVSPSYQEIGRRVVDAALAAAEGGET